MYEYNRIVLNAQNKEHCGRYYYYFYYTRYLYERVRRVLAAHCRRRRRLHRDPSVLHRRQR